MLRRGDPQSSDEQTEAQERPIRTVIVIGASVGGRAAIGTVKGLVARYPGGHRRDAACCPGQ